MSMASCKLRAIPLGLAALLLAACAGTPERAEQSGAAVSAAAVGESPDAAELMPAAAFTTIAPGQVHSSMTSRRDALRRLLSSETARGDLRVPELRADDLSAVWRVDALFADGGAELQPQTLRALSRVARWLRADGATVLQIVAQANAADPDSLAERRAEAITAFLIAEGAPAQRVRAQVVDVSLPRAAAASGGSIANASDVLRCIVAPVIAGREALAWIPPAID